MKKIFILILVLVGLLFMAGVVSTQTQPDPCAECLKINPEEFCNAPGMPCSTETATSNNVVCCWWGFKFYDGWMFE